MDEVTLSPAVHQVAGHGCSDGHQGSLVDESGRFYKPLIDERGTREIAFYNHLQQDESISQHVLTYFPKFYGTINLPSADGSESIRHGIMENLTQGFEHPSITDIKMGARTWYPEAGENYIKKSIVKDNQTTSAALGFRISGMQVHEAASGTTWKPDRKWWKNITVDMVTTTLKRFVSSNPSNEGNPDCAFASSVYGGPQGALAQLKVLKEWFSTQTSFHFASSSILLIYEGSSATLDEAGNPSQAPISVSVKLVDFAHCVASTTVDENFLSGLKSLISILSGIVESQEASLGG